MIEIFLVNVWTGCITILGIIGGLVVLVMTVDMLFGKSEPTTKTSSNSTVKGTGIVCDWDASDEAQRRFMAESIRTHEESMRMAAKEAWDAHTTACDQHQTAVDMHNDFACNSCNPWF